MLRNLFLLIVIGLFFFVIGHFLSLFGDRYVMLDKNFKRRKRQLENMKKILDEMKCSPVQTQRLQATVKYNWYMSLNFISYVIVYFIPF